MASEWARRKAVELCTEEHQSWHTTECGQCANLSAALDAAEKRGRAEAYNHIGYVAPGIKEAEKRGAERERWECHQIAAKRGVRLLQQMREEDDWDRRVRAEAKSTEADFIAILVCARGPMRGPEEE